VAAELGAGGLGVGAGRRRVHEAVGVVGLRLVF
jgi:hypothetical protein